MSMSAAELKILIDIAGADRAISDMNRVGRAVDDTGGRGKGFLSNVTGTMLGVFGGGLISGAVGHLFNLGQGFISANASAEMFRNQLDVAAGSTEKAGQIFDFVKTMAKDSPFEMPELVQAAANLESLGQSSQKWLPIIGDTAAATNKSVDQVTQAVLDAQTGEFERLKEFGIRTQVEGDKVRFSFMKNGQMMTVEAENTSDGISNALADIWSDKYTGSMETMSNTFIGQLSTLKDNMAMIAQSISKPIFDGLKKGMEFANNFIGPFTSMLSQGVSPMAAASLALRAALVDTFGEETANKVKGFADGLISVIGTIISVVTTVAGAIGSAIGAAVGFIQQHWGTISAIFGTIAGVIGSVFGFLADHFGTITTVILPAVGAVFMVVQAFGAFQAASAAIPGALTAIKTAILGLSAPMLIAAAVVAALVIAYQTNFLGFADLVNGAVSKVISVVSQLVSYLQSAFSGGWMAGINKIATDIAGLGDRFTPLKQAFQELGTFIKMLIPVIFSFKNAFSQLMAGDFSGAWTSFKAGVMGALQAGRQFLVFINTLRSQLLGLLQTGIENLFSRLASAFPAFGSSIRLVGSLLSNVIGVVKNLGDAFAALLSGDIGGFFSSLGDAAIDAAQAILSAMLLVPSLIINVFRAIDWGGVWSGLVSGFGSALSGASGLIGGWASSIGSAISSGLQAAGDWVMSSFQAAWDAISNIDWGQFIPGLSWSDFIGYVGDLGAWIGEKITNIPWTDLIQKVLNLGAFIANGITSIPWMDLIQKVLNLGAFIANGITSIPWLDLVQKVLNLGAFIANGITNIPWTSLIQKVLNLGAFIANGITNIPWMSLIQKVLNLGAFIANGITNIPWTSLIDKVSDLGSGILGKIDDLASKIVSALGLPKLDDFSIPTPSIDDILNWIFGEKKEKEPKVDGTVTVPPGTIPNDPEHQALAPSGSALFKSPYAQQATITLNAQDNASPVVANLKAALMAIPPEKLSQLRQAGGELVSSVSERVQGAIGNIPSAKSTALSALGGEQFTGTTKGIKAGLDEIPETKSTKVSFLESLLAVAGAQAVKQAVNAIPESRTTSIRQVGAEVVSAASGITRSAISAIPTSWLSFIRQNGGEQVTSVASGARSALVSIPTSRFTAIAQAGAGSVANAARDAASAIYDIPTFRQVTVAIVVSGLSAAQNALAGVGAHARGGYVDTATTWLAEQGRELLRTPAGEWFMARQKALYSVPMGSYVYTNAETERMMGNLAPVPAYASGGVVGGGYVPRPMQANAAPTQNTYLIVDPEFLRDLPDAVRSMRALSTGEALRALVGEG